MNQPDKPVHIAKCTYKTNAKI